MKKFLKYFLIMMFLLLTACGKVTEREARTALSKHLKARYNEEFCIGLIGKRSDGSKTWYEAEIYPKKHRGDRYYYSSGNVNIKKSLFGESIDYVGDIYSLVLLNESANEFYLPKLKELFGENVLPIFNTDVGRLAIKPDFYTTLKESKEENRILELKGGIYIFGRVENDEDREKYREEIYKFLSFMKETGTFEYVSLGIEIIDERSLTNYFDNNRNNLFKAKQKYKTADEFIKYREKIFKEAEKEFNQMTEEDKKTKINNYLKSDFMRENFIKNGDNAYSVLYHVGIISPKYQSTQPQEEGKINEYSSLNDIKLLNRMKLIYKEYFINKDGEVILTN